ncbi:MAG: hypothetical protein SGI86_15325 [Deltaproteobacteria bacterium]|nr:hypothetical protein [Deltaproteobacteria bacterium]
MNIRNITAIAIALSLFAPVGTANAAERTPDDILRDYEKASGGTNPWKKRKAVRIRQVVSLRGMNLQGAGETIQTKGGAFLVVQELPVVGKLTKASNGKVIWSQDKINGLRILEGNEADQARLESMWQADLRLRTVYPTRKIAPSETTAEECVELATKGSPPIVRCFDKQTHLATTMKGTAVSPQGETPYLVKFLDYALQDGIMLSRRQEVSAGPAMLDIRLEGIEWDPKLNPSIFKLPKVK